MGRNWADNWAARRVYWWAGLSAVLTVERSAAKKAAMKGKNWAAMWGDCWADQKADSKVVATVAP